MSGEPVPVGNQGMMGGPRGDMDIALEGGGTFLTRLNRLADAKDQAAEALRGLNLGKSIEAAQAEAKANLAQSKTIRACAEADAKAAAHEAANVRARAQSEAAKLVADARTQAKKLNDEATAVLGRAKVEADRLVAEAAKDRATAAGETEAAHAVLQAADEAGGKHTALRLVAEKAHEDAKAVQARYEAKLARIEAFAAELRGNGS